MFTVQELLLLRLALAALEGEIERHSVLSRVQELRLAEIAGLRVRLDETVIALRAA